MKLLGFNFTKISSQREREFSLGNVNTRIEFLDIEKDKVEVLKDADVLKVSFSFNVDYLSSNQKNKKPGEVCIEGILVISVDKEESKKILKEWKEKALGADFRASAMRIILNKCSVKAFVIEQDLGLPLHLPISKILPK